MIGLPTQEKSGSDKFTVAPPTLSLPKGGGAVRGIDEKFSVNAVNGMASFSIPIAATAGRAGFGPQLSLSYNSGAGNGPFGFGWNLSLPSITRKTDKGLPRYIDGEESDVFLLSGAEDLVPCLQADGSRPIPRESEDKVYRIFSYRPRIEGLFARIERWVNKTAPADMFWRSISKDNLTTYYGKTPEARIFDPENPQRVFEWLIEETKDDKGNRLVYEYKQENGRPIDLTRVSEKTRKVGPEKFANRYLKFVRYGNQTPGGDDFLFWLVFDYGEHAAEAPAPNRVACFANDSPPWALRPDPFSTYRAGFEIRTYRLCRRVLMFHLFPELPVNPCLVRSTDLNHAGTDYSFLTSVVQRGYVWDAQAGGYSFKSLPPVEFTYSAPRIQSDIGTLDDESLENLPVGIDGRDYQWTDLENEGISGILTEQADAWYYKHNLGEGRFGPLELVAVKPSPGSLRGGAHQLMDLAGDKTIIMIKNLY